MEKSTGSSQQNTFQKKVITLLWVLIIGLACLSFSMVFIISDQHKIIVKQNKEILIKQNQIFLQLSGKINPIVIPDQIPIKDKRPMKDKTCKKRETKESNG